MSKFILALCVVAFVIFELPVFGMVFAMVIGLVTGNADTAQAVYLWCVDTQTAILGFQLWTLR